MVHIREYLISVTAVALLCGILRNLTGEKGISGGIVKLISGIFLALTLIRPLGEIQLKELSFKTKDILQEADAAAREGTDYAQRAMVRHIKERSEAYILDKAVSLGVQITVDIAVSDGQTPIPIGCTISGDLSPYARSELQCSLQEDLGIPEEAIRWIS